MVDHCVRERIEYNMNGRINSRAKGKTGELQFRDFLRAEFNDLEAQRGQQRKGGEQSPDVESPMLRMLKIHPEVKFMAECGMFSQSKLKSWLHQAGKDAGPEDTPVVFHKWNRSGWYAVFLTKYGSVCVMSAEEYLEERLQEHKLSLTKDPEPVVQ